MTPPEPRLMSGSEAAAYCGLVPASFSQWVAAGRLPGPLPGTRRWDRKAIDLALDRLSGIEIPIARQDDDPYLAWKLQDEADQAARAESDWERRYEARKAAERKARPPRK